MYLIDNYNILIYQIVNFGNLLATISFILNRRIKYMLVLTVSYFLNFNSNLHERREED